MRGCIRYAALALLSVAVHASTPSDWVPVRWQGGPLEVARRKLAASAPAAAAIRDWYSPRTLDLLKDTPINCLLVTWSIGAPPEIESEQQKLITAYAREAHRRGIALAGVVYHGADSARAVETAAQAGLDALALTGAASDAQTFARLVRRRGLRVIALGPREWLAHDADWDVLGTDDAVTPRIVISKDGAVMATTTSEPWIDSNTWFVRSIRDRVSGRPVWLGQALEQPSPATYARAIADAAVAGGRWVIAPDDSLMAGMFAGQHDAIATWHSINQTLAFYAEHADWTTLPTSAVLAIIYDNRASEPDIQSEYLNLVMRRRIPYRIVARAALTRASLAGVRAVLATTMPSPNDTERSLLAEFAKTGGLVVGGPDWALAPGALTYKEDWADPERVAKDVLDALDLDELPARLFNVSSMLAHVAGGSADTKLLVQLVNYATEPSDLVTVRVNGPYKAAYLFRPGTPPSELELRRSGDRIEVRFKNVAVCAAVLFEK